MKNNRFSTLVLVAFFVLASSAAVAQAPTNAKIEFTQKDRLFAVKYMDETKADYLGQLSGLSDAQLNFRAAPGRWTIAEIAEHITVVEETLFGMMTTGAMKPEAAKCDSPFRVSDGMIIGAVTNRTRKATAPEQVVPNGRWKTVPTLMASFEKTRGTTMEFMKNNKADLRNLFGPSPFGTVDGVQQMLFIVAHSERHLAQLKEVKADPNFPKK